MDDDDDDEVPRGINEEAEAEEKLKEEREEEEVEPMGVRGEEEEEEEKERRMTLVRLDFLSRREMEASETERSGEKTRSEERSSFKSWSFPWGERMQYTFFQLEDLV